MRKRFITEEEKKLWDIINKETKPLEKITTKSTLPDLRKKIVEKNLPVLKEEILFQNTFSDSPAVLPNSSGPLPFLIDAIDRRTSRKIRKQSLSIEARLDLHGLYQKEAYERLKVFLATSHQKGYKLVLIITGKGIAASRKEPWSNEYSGVLKKNIPQWLKNKSVFPQVLSISIAQPQDGGHGAYYIFLKKLNK